MSEDKIKTAKLKYNGAEFEVLEEQAKDLAAFYEETDRTLRELDAELAELDRRIDDL